MKEKISDNVFVPVRESKNVVANRKAPKYAGFGA